MIETWFAVAIMLGVHSDGTQDVFVFQQPKEHGHFHSSVECRDYVRDNPIPLIKTLVNQYGSRPIQKVLCVSEENVRQFIQERDIDFLKS
jgi:hypothetical protein